jgi:hypothetical protein
MMRILFILFVALLAGYLYLQGRVQYRESELPVFLRTDPIALSHSSQMSISVHSLHQPEPKELEVLSKDYGNLWAHLNHAYATNDISSGKEYYTEDWYKQLCNHAEDTPPVSIIRKDIEHHLHIKNWSPDGLACAVIDSNVVLSYEFPDKSVKNTLANIAVILLFQGDHWRLDAMRIIEEKEINNN